MQCCAWPFEMDGEFTENTAQLPSETSSSTRNDYPPANLNGMTLYSLDRNGYAHWFAPLYRRSILLATQWKLPVALSDFVFEHNDGILKTVIF